MYRIYDYYCVASYWFVKSVAFVRNLLKQTFLQSLATFSLPCAVLKGIHMQFLPVGQFTPTGGETQHGEILCFDLD